MRRIPFVKPSSFLSDGLIFLFVAGVIYGITAFAQQWEASYNPSYEIDLSLSSVPLYAAFSALRGLIAYFVSLVFTLVVGYWAAKSPRAEKIILPFLDVMQSIPVLGFLPGLVMGLVALFPRTNVGLELASILMIFTGQVWNMAFAFYSSLKAVPTELKEAASVMKLSSSQRLKLLELPFAAMSLTWNSVMSMAGGWFFLTVCEAFTLGEQKYRLPGLGAYMAVAIEAGDRRAMVGGVVGMIAMILLFDILLWRPALVWAHRFRLEETEAQKQEEPLLGLLIRDSLVARLVKEFNVRRNRMRLKKRIEKWKWPAALPTVDVDRLSVGQRRVLRIGMQLLIAAILIYGAVRLASTLMSLPLKEWFHILANTAFTMARVLSAVLIGTLWATPAGIWIAQNPRRLRLFQPFVQLAASFPAPMLYPLAIAAFIALHLNFEFSSMLLMLLGVQWYILFNVIAGAMRIPVELRYGMRLIGSSRRDQWRYLFLPSVLPSLVTGWVTAAGGAWNASIVSELIEYKGQTLEAHGLGAEIAKAAAHGDFPKLASCLFVMVVVVVAFNRLVWSRIYKVAQTRFRMDL